ncbi:MAG: type secretion system protein [Candidatus Solibacter sp.]|jgi:tight adherence protein C|nr:type secretion system protein [Candidatus Solibacter sp.]
MLEVYATLLFILVAGVTTALGLSLGAKRSRALNRLVPEGAVRVRTRPSPRRLWRELVARIGALVPSGDQSLLKKRLLRAGIRSSNAVRYFHGARAMATIGLGGAALVWGLRTGSDNLLLGVGAMAATGFIAPMQYVLMRMRRRKRAIEKGLPNALDLMVVCVESGLGIDQAIIQVSKELVVAHPEICDEFALMNLELRAGKPRADALHNLADRTGIDDVRKLVAVLVQTDRFGTSIASSLRGHADYLRTMARQRAEEQAAKLAVKLVFPIFFCVLPSLFIVTIGPVMTRLVRDLIPMIENM